MSQDQAKEEMQQVIGWQVPTVTVLCPQNALSSRPLNVYPQPGGSPETQSPELLLGFIT